MPTYKSTARRLSPLSSICFASLPPMKEVDECEGKQRCKFAVAEKSRAAAYPLWPLARSTSVFALAEIDLLAIPLNYERAQPAINLNDTPLIGVLVALFQVSLCCLGNSVRMQAGSRRRLTTNLAAAHTAYEGRQVACGNGRPSLRSDRHDFRLVLGELCDCRLADIQVLGHHRRRRTGDPVGQRDIGEIGSSEHLEELQVRVACVLDVVSEVLLDVADVARVEVHGDGVRAGVEDRHLPFALDPVLPFIGVGMPVHLPQAAGTHRDQRGSDGRGNREVAAVGNVYRAALGLARGGSRSKREGEGVRRRALSADRVAVRREIAGLLALEDVEIAQRDVLER